MIKRYVVVTTGPPDTLIAALQTNLLSEVTFEALEPTFADIVETDANGRRLENDVIRVVAGVIHAGLGCVQILRRDDAASDRTEFLVRAVEPQIVEV